MLQKAVSNAQSLPSTIPGIIVMVATLILTFTNNPLIQGIVSLNPAWGKVVAGIVGIATGLLAIFAVGSKTAKS